MCTNKFGKPNGKGGGQGGGGGRGKQGTKTFLTTMGHGAIIMCIKKNLVLCSNSICDNCN
jgi:hypothetical protein